MKRDATQTIWRTVVFAGAMLGAPACTKKAAPTTPTNPSNAQPAPGDPAAAPTAPTGTETASPAPNAPPAGEDVCSGDRPRGTDDDVGGGGVGRGFVLS